MKTVLFAKVFVAGFFLLCATCFLPSVAQVATDHMGYNLSFVASAEAKEKKRKTRKLPGISQAAMKRLEKITDLTTGDPDKGVKADFPAALKELKNMEKYCNKKCNDYEKAQVFRFYAFAYYSMDDYPRAIQAYKKVYAKSPQIPIAVELDALNSLSQLSYAQENYNDALKYLSAWMELSTIVGADKFFLRGSIKYSKGDKKGALVDVSKAVSRIEKAGKVPREQWYSLQLALNLEKEKYKSSKPILEKLLKEYPKVKWWVQYSNINGLLGKEDRQLGSLDAVSVMGGLAKRQDIVNSAYLYLGADVPYKAGVILEKGMKDKKVDRDVKNLKILTNAWRMAQEKKKAIGSMKQAVKAAVKEDAANKKKKSYKPQQGNMYAELVGLYSDIDDSKSAIAAGKNALRVGELKKPCEVHTNMGIAYVDIKQFKSAISSFEKARKDKQCRAFVNNWIKFAKNEQRQKEALAQ